MNNKWLLLSIGGVAGTFLRYAVAAWIPGVAGTNFPYGTFAVNLSACLAIGLLSGLAGRGSIGPDGRLLFMTGFCGAYSTFSTWILETASLAGDGQTLRVLANLLGSVGFGFLFFRSGLLLAAVF